jgi:hypothetical protein
MDNIEIYNYLNQIKPFFKRYEKLEISEQQHKNRDHRDHRDHRDKNRDHRDHKDHRDKNRDHRDKNRDGGDMQQDVNFFASLVPGFSTTYIPPSKYDNKAQLTQHTEVLKYHGGGLWKVK